MHIIKQSSAYVDINVCCLNIAFPVEVRRQIIN